MKHRLSRTAALPAALAAVLAPASFAQQPPDEQATQSAPTTLDRIEVTGSRIPRAEIENEQPIITISRDQIQKQGFNSVADILQNLTSAGSPNISRADALGKGEAVGGYYIDIRNLGANRTLVLLNGKRLGVTTQGAQDLGQVPFSAIERIEILKDGASSIYGSDAIAAVVNVITRRNFDGAEANAYIGSFSQGDGEKQSYDITLGASGNRVGLVLSAEYSKEDPVLGKDRWFSKYGNSGQDYPYAGWSPVTQNGVWLLGHCPVDPTVGIPLCTLDKGTDPRDPDNYHALDYPERANPNEVMYVQTGIERRSLFVSGTLDITDSMRFLADLGYNKRSTTQQVAGHPGSYSDAGPLSAQSYFNPAPGEGDLYFYRRQWEVPRTTRSDMETLRTSLGLEGVLDFGARQWNWDAGYLSNRNTINKYLHGFANLMALQAALGPSFLNPANGRVECGTLAQLNDPDNPNPGYGSNIGNSECIPYNPLLPYQQAGQGSLADPALQAYLFPEEHDAGRTQTRIYNLNLAGSLFDLPAGEMGLAVGYEHRIEDGRFVPDALVQAGQTQDLPGTTTAGNYSLDEAYLELEVPVLAGVPFAKELTFNLASRYSEYSNFGNTTNNKFQMRWRPMDGLLVRATYAEGFRAPTISDLYGGVSGTFEFYTDPCQRGQPGAGNATCTAAGVPANYVQIGQGNIPCSAFPCQAGYQFLSGSNPDLGPESSESKTAGVVWSPKWVEGLDLTLDWFDMKVDDIISSDSVDSILRDCYVSNIISRCAGVERDPTTHAVTNLFFGEVNLGALHTEGYDFGVNYRLPEFAIGRFTVNWQTSYTSKYDILADSSPETRWEGFVGDSSGGTAGIFRIRSNLGIGWEKGDYSVSYMARYYSGIAEACTPDPNPNPLNYPPYPCDDPDHVDVYGNAAPLRHTGSNVFHDLQVAVKLPWNATVAVGADNLFEHYGPLLFSTPNSDFAYYGGFDIGRFLYFKYQQRF